MGPSTGRLKDLIIHSALVGLAALVVGGLTVNGRATGGDDAAELAKLHRHCRICAESSHREWRRDADATPNARGLVQG